MKIHTHYHLIGIKGVGMTSLALCYQDMGIRVTGWDVDETFVTDRILNERRVEWSTEPTIPGHPDLIVTTGAHGGLNNPLILNAKQQGFKVITHAEALGIIMNGKKGISICGVGGKTSTNAIISTIFDRAGLHPSFENGVGNIASLGVPGRFDPKGKYFIAEADEYAISPGIDNRPRFTYQQPEAIVVTNIEHDHPDIYPDLESTKKVFESFFSKLKADDLLVGQVDNKNTSEALNKVPSKVNKITVGFSPRASWRIIRVHSAQEMMFITIQKGQIEEKLTLKIPGDHNALNAVCAAVVASHYGISWEGIKKGLFEFTGTMRRFEFIGESKTVKLYDDYAHHPSEIKALIKAAKSWFPGKRLVLAFQPHTFSRTKALFAQFVQSLSLSDVILVCDIFPSKRETPDPEVTSEKLALEISKRNRSSYYVGNTGNLRSTISTLIKPYDIVITAGAGDIYHQHPEILSELKNI